MNLPLTLFGSDKSFLLNDALGFSTVASTAVSVQAPGEPPTPADPVNAMCQKQDDVATTQFTLPLANSPEQASISFLYL